MTVLVGAVDVGATKTLVTVRTLPLRTWVTGGSTVRIPTPASPGALIDQVASALEALAAEAGGAIAAIGLGTPGPLDAARGIIVHSPNQGWRDVPLGPLLAERTGRSVDLDDDANTGALGEEGSQRDVSPALVGRPDDRPLRHVDRSGRPHADGDDRAARLCREHLEGGRKHVDQRGR